MGRVQNRDVAKVRGNGSFSIENGQVIVSQRNKLLRQEA